MGSDSNGAVPAYKDAALPVGERVRDLLSRMTLEEKVRQMDQYRGWQLVDKVHPDKPNAATPDAKILWDRVREVIGTAGIGCIHDLYATADINNRLQRYAVEETRLGIPILFASEALHGFSQPGCTIFPQAIALAGTWDPALVERVAHAVAAEARSNGVHEAFAPVLDLARDPRWGRVEETYGEDPCLAGRMAVAYVRGFQGDDVSAPDRIVAEPKHFAGHGQPSGGLNCAPAAFGPRELHMYHLPVFRAAFVEAGAVNAMCSYNSIDGVPCAQNQRLLTGLLRDEWHMPGFVRADLGAVARLHERHHTAATPEEALRRDGRMSEETLDRAVGRILRVKFLLGLFDHPYVEPERRGRVVRCEEHQRVALQAAREAVCLLKNDRGLLPLAKDIASIAVIGPGAATARLGDYCAPPHGFEPVTLLDGIERIVSPQTRVEYALGTGILPQEHEVVPQRWLRDGEGCPGLRGEYFDNPALEGDPVLVRTDPKINFNWIETRPTDRARGAAFSVRWTGTLVPGDSFEGRIGTVCSDSMRVWVDDELLLDGWGPDTSGTQSVPFVFEAGREHRLRIEYRYEESGARVRFVLVRRYGDEDIRRAVEAAAAAEVAVVALGDSTDTCGEGADRACLDLPGRQGDLLRAVHATGTPVVLVLQNGRPLTLAWEAEHIPAIVEAWYVGEKGGRAIAEVLFGEVNPAGRLPVSFPKSTGQLPIYYNRCPGGSRNYVDSDSEPLFPFGCGLSYTTFAYEGLRIRPQRIGPDGEVEVSFDVANTGTRAGDEVVQLYVRDRYSSVVRPRKELKRFRRLSLDPGRRETVVFRLGPQDLKLLNEDFEWVVEPGVFDIMIGPNSAETKLAGEVEVI